MGKPFELVPRKVTMDLRSDDSFVEDDGWRKASESYFNYLLKHKRDHVLYLTPVISKYPFWQMTAENPNSVYACINYGEAYCPKQI